MDDDDDDDDDDDGDDDIRIKPTTWTQYPTILRKVERVLLCATLHSHSIPHHTTPHHTTAFGRSNLVEDHWIHWESHKSARATCLRYKRPMLSPGPHMTLHLIRTIILRDNTYIPSDNVCNTSTWHGHTVPTPRQPIPQHPNHVEVLWPKNTTLLRWRISLLCCTFSLLCGTFLSYANVSQTPSREENHTTIFERTMSIEGKSVSIGGLYRV